LPKFDYFDSKLLKSVGWRFVIWEPWTIKMDLKLSWDGLK
jgi:hypothetical protein